MGARGTGGRRRQLIQRCGFERSLLPSVLDTRHHSVTEKKLIRIRLVQHTHDRVFAIK